MIKISSLRRPVQASLQKGIDLLFAQIPQPRPSAEALAQARLVAHRGAHDGRRVLENTLEAFETACRAGAWGLEFDVRWTSDHVPVVHHDVTLERLFKQRFEIEQVSFK